MISVRLEVEPMRNAPSSVSYKFNLKYLSHIANEEIQTHDFPQEKKM